MLRDGLFRDRPIRTDDQGCVGWLHGHRRAFATLANFRGERNAVGKQAGRQVGSSRCSRATGYSPKAANRLPNWLFVWLVRSRPPLGFVPLRMDPWVGRLGGLAIKDRRSSFLVPSSIANHDKFIRVACRTMRRRSLLPPELVADSASNA